MLIIYSYGVCHRILGKGTGGVVRLVKRNDGRVFAVKEFRQRRKDESPKLYAENLTREYCISNKRFQLHSD